MKIWFNKISQLKVGTRLLVVHNIGFPRLLFVYLGTILNLGLRTYPFKKIERPTEPTMWVGKLFLESSGQKGFLLVALIPKYLFMW